MKTALFTFLCLFTPVLWAVQEEESETPTFDWQTGPIVRLANYATLDLNKRFVFLNGDETRRLMALYGNPPTNQECGLVASAEDPYGWFVCFEFDKVGYVKDSDRDEIDADSILDDYKKGSKASNKHREEMGMPPLNIIGWKVKPNYDVATNNLEWCLEFESEGEPVLNHNIKILGREGVMNAVLVCDPEIFDSALAETREVLKDFHYVEGKRYADFVKGDKIAEYGLTALVAGGAVAVAAKSGILGKLLKPILIGLAAVGAFLKNFIKRLFGRGDEDAT
ncbi:MAG: DUF2167 domain-containing protein [Acidobacteria bacterium]|nr:DUF2167 domain-containing protein [Acidobacteriota bacterium]